MVLEAGDSEAAGAEDVENLDRIREARWGEFVPRVPMNKGPTAGSEMTLPFLCKFRSVIIDPWYRLTVRTCR